MRAIRASAFHSGTGDWRVYGYVNEYVREPLVVASFTFTAKRYTFTYTKNVGAWHEKEPCTVT